MRTILLWFMVSAIVFSIAKTSFGYNIAEIRLCDNSGDCADISASGNLILK